MSPSLRAFLFACATLTIAHVARAFYDPTVGRFLSMDPIDQNTSTSGYDYCGGDPLNYFDPSGCERVAITYRTFIPQSQVVVGGNIYAGDNRSYSTAPTASSRTFVTVVVETDPSVRADPMLGYYSGAGQSSILDANGNPVKTATADTGLPTATASRDSEGNVVVNIQQDTKNPLSPVPQFFTPGIDADLDVTIPVDASYAQVSGSASQFPGEELNVTRTGGNTTPVYQFEPPSTATPYSLMKPDQQVNTPQVQTPKKSCPN